MSKIVETILGKLNADLPPLTLADVNVAHRVGQRGNPNEPQTRPRPIIVQFNCYASKVSVMRSRKQLRETMPDIYINEDLTRARAAIAPGRRFCTKHAKRSARKELLTAGRLTAEL